MTPNPYESPKHAEEANESPLWLMLRVIVFAVMVGPITLTIAAVFSEPQGNFGCLVACLCSGAWWLFVFEVMFSVKPQ